MNRCPKCGRENNINSKFCADCGCLLKTENNGEKKSGNTGLIIAIIALVAVIIVVIIGAFLLFANKGFDEKPSIQQTQVTPPQSTFSTDNVEQAINTYISSYSSHNDIAVAVIDNKTSSKICSLNSSDIYSSWGFYLPVYLAYVDYYGYNLTVLNNILSSDAGVCNNAANSAMKHMGGAADTTIRLYNLFGCNATSYGRFFGDVTATTDNYTNASEAVSLLSEYSKVHYAGNLSYSPSKFGITPPNGTVFNCQIGTENIAKRVNLNIYSIVKGTNSDYCVVILTRNSEGKEHISKLLSLIHTNMEELSK